MELVIPVWLRQYPDDLFIAQTLDAPSVSAAAATADEAIASLRRAVAYHLERVHPRRLARVPTLSVPKVTRRPLPIYETASFVWDETRAGELEADWADAPFDVLTRTLPGGLEEVRLPILGVWTCVEGDDRRGPPESALEDLTRQLRDHSRNIRVHRPPPGEVSVLALEVSFEPLDLGNVPVEMVWLDVFEDDVLAEEEEAPTPTLDEIAQCWSEMSDNDDALAHGFQEAFLRDAKVEDLRNLLGGEIPSAVVLVGPPRVGKTALVKHLVREGIHPHEERERRIWFADPPRLVSSDPTNPFAAGWQQQCRELTSELEESADVLFIGRLVEALDAGKYVGSDYNLAQFLKPLLADRRVRMIAEATVEEWNEVERRDIGFARTFTVVRLDDPPDDVSFEIVRKSARRISEREDVELDEPAVRRAWNLQRRFATVGSPVGRTIDFVGRTLRRAANRYMEEVKVSDLVEEFCDDTGLPPVLLLDERQLDIEDVRATLRERVHGQDEAVRRVADVVGITKAGLSSPDRPLGSFLFVGPTGVGKTELARALSMYLFGTEDRLIRVDMSEYSHSDAYGRLIGEGREDGDLTGPVRRQPFSVVLLDEIEKADPGVFDLLLQVLGEARLTDVTGRTTRFQNTIVIMTSNLGVETMSAGIGFSDGSDVVAKYATHFRREAEKFFRPEFLARIDQFIPFRPLDRETVESIANRELDLVRRRDGLRSQDVDVTFGDNVAAWTAVRGYDERYGARPLKRVIEQELVWRLSAKLAGSRRELEPGMSRKVHIRTSEEDVETARLIFELDVKQPRASDASARRALLAQIDEIAALRRRLQRYMYTSVYNDLEWEVESFDVSSQSAHFWQDPNAAEIATRAERARRVIEPAAEVAQELAALEDLANEAYHTRSFALSEDLTSRLDQLEARVTRIVMDLLCGAYEDSDSTVLFIPGRTPDDPWRDQLVEWYQTRCETEGWKFQLWRSLPMDDDTPRPGSHYDENRQFWEKTDEPRGEIVAVEIEGFAAFPLHRGEDGLQRLISSNGNAVVDVAQMDEYDNWPFPVDVPKRRPYARVVKVYNERTGELVIADRDPIPLDTDDPWPAAEQLLEDLAWEITEGDW